MLAVLQDLGRPGQASLGVGHGGAADRGALALANRLVGNPVAAAGIEVTFGGLGVRAIGHLVVAVTGAPCPLRTTAPDGRARARAVNAVFHLRPGEELWLDPPASGLRSYLAVRGGITVPPVLGSRSTDTLANIGPDRLSAGAVLPVGVAANPLPAIDFAPVPGPGGDEVWLRVLFGPRDDWFTAEAREHLVTEPYLVTSEMDRVGMRLSGPALARARTGELPSEGMVRGALQVPPSGQPTLFLADHPLTGGYPVIAVVVDADIDRAAQARPGQRIRFRAASSPGASRPAGG